MMTPAGYNASGAKAAVTLSEGEDPSLPPPPAKDNAGPKAVNAHVASGDPTAAKATEALWLKDTYNFSATATALAVASCEEPGHWDVVLDATPFHPQGGGQPSDIGLLVAGEREFDVVRVHAEKSGVVHHEIRHAGTVAPFAAGATVECKVDEAVRRGAARLHSGGHLIDVAMSACGCTLQPTKGYHFSPGAYVEYAGKLSAEERDTLATQLQAQIDALVAQSIPTSVQMVPAHRLGEVCASGTVATNFLEPSEREKLVRVVSVGGLPGPCGGTHVRHTGEIGRLVIDGVKSKGKGTRVSYHTE